MPSIQLMKHCNSCGRKTLHIQQQQGTATNLVHIILVVMTLGLWLVLWALAQPIRAMTEPPKCTVCGKSSRGFSLPNQPNPPQGQNDTITEDRIPCPFCAELIKREAKICRYCQRDLPEQEAEAAVLVEENTDPTEPEPEWEYKGITITRRGRDYYIGDEPQGYVALPLAKAIIDGKDREGQRIPINQGTDGPAVHKSTWMEFVTSWWALAIIVFSAFVGATLWYDSFWSADKKIIEVVEASQNTVEPGATNRRVCDIAVRHGDGEWEKAPDFAIWVIEARNRSLTLADCEKLLTAIAKNASNDPTISQGQASLHSATVDIQEGDRAKANVVLSPISANSTSLAEINKLRDQVRTLTRSLALAQEELKLMSPAVRAGIVSRAELFRTETRVNDLEAELAATKLALTRADSSASRSFDREADRITQAIKCRRPKITPPGYDLGYLYGCVSGSAETVKVFVNEVAGTGKVKNIKIMWNDWFQDGGWGVHADQTEARRIAETVLNLYDPAQSERFLKAFFANSDTAVTGLAHSFNYTYRRGPKIDERLIVITPSQQGSISTQQIVQKTQNRLNVLGYSAGSEDGILGPQTRRAIEDFQRDQSIGVTGKPSEHLLEKLKLAKPPQVTASSKKKKVARVANPDDSVTSAYKVCSTFDGTGITSEPCNVSGWDASVKVRINMIPSEARTLCGQVVRKARNMGWGFNSGWKLKIYSPYSGDNTIAYCNF